MNWIKDKIKRAWGWTKRNVKKILIGIGILGMATAAVLIIPGSTEYKDYKFWFIRRDDNGFITEAAIRFYEGEYQDIEIDDIVSGEKITVNKYVRIKRLGKTDLEDLESRYIKDSAGRDAVLYTQEDFGQIKTDDELRKFLNKELGKIKGRKAIKEQKIKQ